MQAGLAGGSADAAATLIGLNELYKRPLDTSALLRVGAELGADVPFCITCGTSFADGRGDMLREAAPMPECYIVVSREGEGVSTPWAYGELDRIYRDFKDTHTGTAQEILDALDASDLRGVCQNMKNIFESAVIPCRPCVEKLKSIFVKNGALGALMSGSGTAVFGVFDNIYAAERCVKELKNKSSFAVICTPIAKRP